MKNPASNHTLAHSHGHERHQGPTTPRRTARDEAIRLLSRRPLSEHEVRTKLQHKGHTPEHIQEAIVWAASYGYIDDQALAEMVAREAERTGRGPYWVQQKLRQRGISAPAGTSIPSRSTAQVAERARAVATRRFGDASQWDLAQRHKVFRFLLRRGFSGEEIQQAFKGLS